MSGGMDYKHYDCIKCGERLRENSCEERDHKCKLNYYCSVCHSITDLEYCSKCLKMVNVYLSNSKVANNERVKRIEREHKNLESYTDPTMCNHYHECPNICPCASNCGCKLTVCKESKMDDGMPRNLSGTQQHELIEADRRQCMAEDRNKMSAYEGSALQDSRMNTNLGKGKPIQDPYITKCCKCSKAIGSTEVHDFKNCLTREERERSANLQEQKAKIDAIYTSELLKRQEPMKSPTPSDEDLARMFFDYVKQHGNPTRIPEDSRGELIGFDDLTIKNIREMAAFVKAMRQLIRAHLIVGFSIYRA